MESPIELTMEARDAFKQHVLKCYPEEACGLIRDKAFVPCKNVHTEPTKAFKIDGRALVKPYEAVLHSHPYQLGDDTFKMKNNPAWASARDIEMYNTGNVPWGIIATDGEGVSEMNWLFNTQNYPLLGRDFVHGTFDCYAVVRDAYWQNHSIDLPNYPRQYDWWNSGEDLYSSNFADAGFYEITKEEATIGDAVLMQLMSPVINHAAIITGNNEITHHNFHRLSETDSLNKWKKIIVKYLRHNQVNQGSL